MDSGVFLYMVYWNLRLFSLKNINIRGYTGSPQLTSIHAATIWMWETGCHPCSQVPSPSQLLETSSDFQPSRGHVVTVSNIPCWLLASNVNGQASRKSEVAVAWGPRWMTHAVLASCCQVGLPLIVLRIVCPGHVKSCFTIVALVTVILVPVPSQTKGYL